MTGRRVETSFRTHARAVTGRAARVLSVAPCSLSLIAALSGASCSVSSGQSKDLEPITGTTFQDLAASPPGTTPPIDPRASLFITDTEIVNQFSLEDVLNQLLQQARDAGAVGPASALALFQQMFSTETAPGCMSDPTDTAEGQFREFDGGLAPAGEINGWPAECPEEESAESTPEFNPFPDAGPGADAAVTDNEFMATTLANRFDLASPDGSDCGEYRLNFARRSGADPNGVFPRQLARLFIAFEARVPNPNRAEGLQGCQPIESFWAGLTNLSESARASQLKSFYFTGLPQFGIGPVISIGNYGANPASNHQSSGQVRINQFFFPTTKLFQDWSPREFLLKEVCTSGSCILEFTPSFDKNTPAPELFDPANKSASSFQTSFFPAQVPRLALNDPNTFNYASTVPGNLNTGDDQMITTADDYTLRFDGGPSTFTSAIQTELTAIGSSLTPQQIVARAMAQSCAGCHSASLPSQDGGTPTSSPAPRLGGGISFLAPDTADTMTAGGFVQVGEDTEPIPDASTPDATRFIAQPLVTQFVNYRLEVMKDFLFPVTGFEQAGAWSSSEASVSLVSSPVTADTSALEVVPANGWSEIDSVPFATFGLAPITPTLNLDVFLPTHQTNLTWFGTIAVLFSSPSAGLTKVQAGTVELTGLNLGVYNTISMPLPASVEQALTFGVSDLTVDIQLNVNRNTSPYFLDNLRFH
ncbi:MAG: hypothetical protein ABSC94_27810 [Polyangiaceae bacterium]